MSCVAEPNAVNKANPTKGANDCCGLLMAMPSNPAITQHCASNNQLRRLPSQTPNSGMGNRSTSGAQAHFEAVGQSHPTQKANRGAVYTGFTQPKTQGSEHQQQRQTGGKTQGQHAQTRWTQVNQP